jgi:hypothetical protein
MSKEATDPRMERLIAFLYGEMPEEEARVFRRELEKDHALRQEMEELRETRAILGGWKVPEPTPSFVFLREEREALGPVRWWKKLTHGPLGFGLGLATASAAILVFMGLGFRMEQVDGGFAFRFGKEEAAPRTPVAPLENQSIPLELAMNEPATSASAGSDSSEYLTRAEFEKLAGQMVGSVVDLLNEYGDRQHQEVSGVLQTMYSDLSDRQNRESEELRHRMHALGVELLLRQARGGRPGGLEMEPSTSSSQRETVSPWRTPDWKEEQR